MQSIGGRHTEAGMKHGIPSGTRNARNLLASSRNGAAEPFRYSCDTEPRSYETLLGTRTRVDEIEIATRPGRLLTMDPL
jgi:hypothetical protein